ncbi:MAG: alpha/beta hydrolase [Acidobacteriota bacterium]|nr:MAG: alpha/beta hydrolase [Acidobacteriota bacterium]
MTTRRIHFAHANGFPSLTYTKLFSLLEPEFAIGYLEKHAHNPDYPVTDNWKHLAHELGDEIAERYTEPVIGVGHSLGGVLHLLASFDRPELFSAIVLLDAPIISPASSFGLKVLKTTGLLKRYPPASTTRFRRRSFGSREEAREYFRSKPRFDAFDPDVLEDYLDHGLTTFDGGIRPTFEPEIEAKIYTTIPTDLPALKGRLKVKTFYIGGTDSYEARLARLGFMKRNFPIEFRFIEGSHLFPLESPNLTALTIKDLLI